MAIDQAKREESAGHIDQAVRALDHSLALWPDHLPTLEIQARLLADHAQTIPQVIHGARTNDRLLRLDPDGPDRQATRRRLIRLYLRYDQAIRESASFEFEALVESLESREQAAVTIARQLLDRGANDAEAHQLMALALEATLTPGNASALLPSLITEYLEAIRLDPGDPTSAERLALICFERLDDPPRAEKQLDALLKARPRSVEARLARHRYFKKAGRADQAKAELDAALAQAPDDLTLRTMAADDALTRHDVASALRHLDAIPRASQDSLIVRIIRGNIEYAQQHPDQALDLWSQGLLASQGSDQALTWQLAFLLIQSGRLNEARPLVTQYRRLTGDDRLAMSTFLEAMLAQRAGYSSRAITLLEKIEDQLAEPWKAEQQLILGRAFEAMGNDAAALSAYRRASTLKPRSTAPLREIARMLRARQPEQALAELKHAIELTPDDPALLLEAGRFLLDEQLARPPEQRVWTEINAILDRLGTDDPRGVRVRLLKADTLAASGRLAEAVTLLEQWSLGIDRRNPETWVGWSRGLELMGRRPEAIPVLDHASQPENAGDRALIRIARARLLVSAGHGQAARQVLSKDRERLSLRERQELARTLGDLNRDLSDREGARVAYQEWAKLAPENPLPGLALVGLSQTTGDDEIARIGLESLKAVGGDQEPYGLTAGILELLREDSLHPGDRKLTQSRLDKAERLVNRLESIAPDLSLSLMIRGMVLERLGRTETAIDVYRKALKDPAMTQVLPRLIGLLARQKRYETIASLKRDYEIRSTLSNRADASAIFDHVAIEAALRSSDKNHAQVLAARIVETRPDNLRDRTSQARLLNELGKPDEAEATLRALIARQPGNPGAWIALVTFQVLRGTPAEAARTIDQIRASYNGDHVEMLLARCHWVIGDQATAADLYEKERARRPNDVETLRTIALFDEATGRLDDLEAILKRVLELDPTARWASRMLALRIGSRPDPGSWTEAWSLVASGESPEDRLTQAALLSRCPEAARRREAGPALSSLILDLPAMHPVAVEARIKLAQAMLESNQPEDAFRTIEPLANQEIDSDPLVLSIAVEACVRFRQLARARQFLEKLEAIEPDSTRTLLANAWVLFALGQPNEAAASIESAQSKAETTAEGETVGVACHSLLMKLGLFDASARLAAKVSQRWPRQSYLLARYQSAKGQVAAALESCRRSIEAGGPREALKLAIGVAMDHHEDLDLDLTPRWLKQVDHLASTELSRSPNDPELIVYLAKIRHGQGRCREERDLYRKALELHPVNRSFLNDMAWDISEVFNEPKEALRWIDDLIQREGRAASSLDTRGIILDRLGRLDEAIDSLEDSARLQPSPITYFHLARTCRKAGKREQFRQFRELASKLGFDPAKLDPSDRDDVDEILKSH